MSPQAHAGGYTPPTQYRELTGMFNPEDFGFEEFPLELEEGAVAVVSFKLPDDFVSIVKCEAWYIPPFDQADLSLNIKSWLGSEGQAETTHNDSDDIDVAALAGVWNVLDYMDTQAVNLALAVAADNLILKFQHDEESAPPILMFHARVVVEVG